jgi:LacI family transcriptional regulator
MERNVTLSDVAAHAGVSLATASRALNGSSRTVNAELQQRVLASAQALRYTANVQAQAVARGTSNTVALVLGDITDPYFSAIASGVVAEAEKRDLVVTMATTGQESDRELAVVTALKGQRPRALIIAGSRRVRATANEASADHEYESSVGDRLDAELAAIERTGGSAVFIGSAPVGFRGVRIRNREGAAALAAALVDQGYSRFAVLAGEPDLVTAAERTAGFVDELESRGASAATVHGGFSRDGGYAAMISIIDGQNLPECVFAVTDVMAVGAMSALRDRGVEPGADVAVAGFDDIQTLKDVIPSLTTVALPLAEIGAGALALALADDATLSDPIDGELRMRDSTPRGRVAAERRP